MVLKKIPEIWFQAGKKIVFNSDLNFRRPKILIVWPYANSYDLFSSTTISYRLTVLILLQGNKKMLAENSEILLFAIKLVWKGQTIFFEEKNSY